MRAFMHRKGRLVAVAGGFVLTLAAALTVILAAPRENRLSESGAANKTSELFTGASMEAVVSGGDPVTKWVEWVNMDPAANGANLHLWAADAVHDRKVLFSAIHFYPFNSQVGYAVHDGMTC